MMKFKIVLFLFMAFSGICKAQSYKVTIIANLPQKYNERPIFMASDINQWNPNSTQYEFQKFVKGKQHILFTTTQKKIEFKCTQGDWATAECDEQGNDIDNRTAVIQSDTTIYITINAFKSNESVKASTASQRVNILNDSFYIPQLKQYRRVWMYLPKAYDGKKKFPVLYMFDGQNIFDNVTSGFGEWGVDECLDTMKKQMIVVAIDHAGSGRLKEYNPYSSTVKEIGQGIGKQFAPFVITLKKYIDKNYKTHSSKAYTFIAGSSMGGLMSYYMAMQYPTVFGKAGVFSPSFWLNMPSVKKEIAGKKLKRNHFYFYAGTAESSELVPQVLSVASQIQKACIKCGMKLSIKTDGKHNEQAWRKELPEFLRWLGKN